MLPFKLVYSDAYYLPIGNHVFPAEKYRRIRDRLIATACQNGVVQLWNAACGKPVGTPMEHNGDVVSQLVFSPDGRRVAVGAKGRSGIRLYTVFVSGGTPVRATSSQEQEFCATWSPATMSASAWASSAYSTRTPAKPSSIPYSRSSVSEKQRYGTRRSSS